MERLPVLNDEGTVIAMVKYTENLDTWDGHNMSAGSMGVHLGITKLKNGIYVLIHGTNWAGQRDTAEIVPPSLALNLILKTGHEELLNDPKFSDLKSLMENKLEKEVD